MENQVSDRELASERREEELAKINKKTGRNMPLAILTGAILVCLVAGVLLWNAHVFTYLIVAFMLVAIWELTIDFAVGHIRLPLVSLEVGATALLLLTWYVPDHFLGLGYGLALALFLVVIGCCIDRMIGNHIPSVISRAVVDARHRAEKSENKTDVTFDSPAADHELFQGCIRNIAAAIFVVLYIPLLASFLVIMLHETGYQWRIMMAVFVPALSDTGGLLFGAAFGKHKLSPRISPKKSYEGLTGSAIFAMIGASLFYGFGFSANYIAGGWWKPLVLGLAITIIGTVGDLSASMLKRDLGIKDMGYILRGHGGVMDRVDSILMAAPVTYFLLSVFGV
jgi:phosphatidate cytidylyltransferase